MIEVMVPDIGCEAVKLADVLKEIGVLVAADETILRVDAQGTLYDITTPEPGYLLAVLEKGAEVSVSQMPVAILGEADSTEAREQAAELLISKQQATFDVSAGELPPEVVLGEDVEESGLLVMSPDVRERTEEMGISPVDIVDTLLHAGKLKFRYGRKIQLTQDHLREYLQQGKQLGIVGVGEDIQEIVEAISGSVLQSSYALVIYAEDAKLVGKSFSGVTVVGDLNTLVEDDESGALGGIVLVLDGDERQSVYDKLFDLTLRAPMLPLVHEFAHVSVTADVGAGVYIAAGAVVEPSAVICPGAIIRSGAVVGFGAVIGAHSEIGRRACIGRKATVAQGMNIGMGTVVGDGVVKKR